MWWKIIDRLIVCFFLAWALILATAIVSKYTRTLKVKGNAEDQISKIYDWCETALAPAKKNQTDE